jgi:hypothetical protein
LSAAALFSVLALGMAEWPAGCLDSIGILSPNCESSLVTRKNGL